MRLTSGMIKALNFSVRSVFSVVKNNFYVQQ